MKAQTIDEVLGAIALARREVCPNTRAVLEKSFQYLSAEKTQTEQVVADATAGFVTWLSGVLEAQGTPKVVAFELADLEADQERGRDGKPTMLEIFTAGAGWAAKQLAEPEMVKVMQLDVKRQDQAEVVGQNPVQLSMSEKVRVAKSLDLLMSLEIRHKGEKAMISASKLHADAANIAHNMRASIQCSPLDYSAERGDDPRELVAAQMVEACQKHRFNVASMTTQEAYQLFRKARLMLADFYKKHAQED